MARDIPWLRTEATQARLRQMASALGMVAVDGGKMWLSGGAKDGWWLSGCVGGDCKLPMTKGARTAQEAFEHAWGWLAPEIEVSESEQNDVCVCRTSTAVLL